MSYAKLYDKSKSCQIELAKYFLDEYFHLIKLRPNCDDRILDIGTGDGEVSVDILLKRFNNKEETLVGCDRLIDHIRYATDKYRNKEKVKFRLLDIETETLPRDMIDGFDHIFSFSCFNWVKNLEQAMKNCYDLLKPNGDIFIAMFKRMSIYDVFDAIWLGDSKWTKYLTDYDYYVPIHLYHECPEENFANIIERNGFDVTICKSYYMEHIYDTMDDFKNMIMSLNPFKHNIPQSELNEFYRYYMDLIVKHDGMELRDDGSLIFKFHVIFASATKKAK